MKRNKFFSRLVYWSDAETLYSLHQSYRKMSSYMLNALLSSDSGSMYNAHHNHWLSNSKSLNYVVGEQTGSHEIGVKREKRNLKRRGAEIKESEINIPSKLLKIDNNHLFFTIDDRAKSHKSPQIPRSFGYQRSVYNIFASSKLRIKGGQVKAVPTDLNLNTHSTHFTFILNSQNLLNRQIILLPTVLDCNFTQHLTVHLYNPGAQDVHIKQGEVIAQAKFIPEPGFM